jgi:hypothetical protein
MRLLRPNIRRRLQMEPLSKRESVIPAQEPGALVSLPGVREANVTNCRSDELGLLFPLLLIPGLLYVQSGDKQPLAPAYNPSGSSSQSRPSSSQTRHISHQVVPISRRSRRTMAGREPWVRVHRACSPLNPPARAGPRLSCCSTHTEINISGPRSGLNRTGRCASLQNAAWHKG